MQRIVLALALTGAAGLVAPQCAVRAPRAVLRAEAAEAPAEATPAPTFKVIDIPSDKWTAAQNKRKPPLRRPRRPLRLRHPRRQDANDAPPAPYAGDVTVYRRQATK